MQHTQRNSFNARARDSTAVAILGKSRESVEYLESLVIRAGYVLASEVQGCESELDGSAKVNPSVVIINLESVSGSDRDELLANRAVWNVPILCLLGLKDQMDPETVANLGANDYMLKPVRTQELVLRIELLLRQSEGSHVPLVNGVPLIERRNIQRRRSDRRQKRSIDTTTRCIIDDASKSVQIEGRKLTLSPKEYDLLCMLASHVGIIMTVNEIIDKVWHLTERASASDVHQYMHMLRAKVESDPAKPRWIITVRGFGYKFVVPEE